MAQYDLFADNNNPKSVTQIFWKAFNTYAIGIP